MRTSRAAQAHAVSIAFPQAQPAGLSRSSPGGPRQWRLGRAGSPFSCVESRTLAFRRPRRPARSSSFAERIAGTSPSIWAAPPAIGTGCLSGFTRGPILSVKRRARAARSHIRGRQSDRAAPRGPQNTRRDRGAGSKSPLPPYDAYVRLFDEEADALPSTLEELPTGARGVDRKHRRTHAGCTSQIPDLVQEVRIRLAVARFVRRRRIAHCSVAPRQSSQDEEGQARGSG